MSVPRVELADPGAEGQKIAEVLRERGFYVVERSIDSLRDGTDAAVVLLAGDADGALEALAAIREKPGTALTPIILLGDPPGRELVTTKAILALGADAYYPRPVSLDRLVRKVETFLAPADTRLKSQPSVAESEPPPAEPAPPSRPIEQTMQLREPSVAEWQPPERTMQLAEDAPAQPPVSIVDSRSSRPPPSSQVSQPVAPLRSPSQPPIGSPVRDTDAPPPAAADLSPRLRRLILDADRRVFPASPPLDLRFPAGDEPAHELVPDELLEIVSLPSEPVEEDPLDAFTYVGPVPQHSATPLPGGAPDPSRAWLSTPSDPAVSRAGDGEEASGARVAATVAPIRRGATPVPRPSARSQGESRRERSERPPSVVETQDEIGFGERTGGGRGRYGELGDSDALRLLWRVMEAGENVGISLALEGLPELRLRIDVGGLAALEGPIATRVLGWLCERGRASTAASDEGEAVAVLERHVAEGTLGRYELDRMLRRAREEIVYDAIASSGGTFEMRPLGTPAGSAPRLLARPLAAVLVEGARRRLTAARVRRLLGSGALGVRLTPIARVRFEQVELEPELVALLERSDGATLDTLLAAAPAEEGVPGVVYAMVAASALRLVASEGDAIVEMDPVGAVRSAIDAAAALAEDGSYYAILGVSRDAAPREIRAAWEARRSELAEVRLAPLGLDELEPRWRLALEAVDEAWEVLSQPRLREAYRYAAPS